MTINTLPAWPTTGDPEFDSKADAIGPALQTFITETNATAAAMSLNSTNDTSTTSNTLGEGSKSFTVSTDKSFQPGMYLVIADTAAPSTNSMVVQVTSYNISTGDLVVSVISFAGSGTKTAWIISLTANVGISSAIAPVLAAASMAEARNLLGVKMSLRRNKWINGNIAIDVRSRGAAKTLTAGAAPIYTVDRIYASCTGANATIQQTVNGNENRLLVTGGAGCTGVVIGTRIISENMGGFDYVTGFATLSALLSCPAGTIISWAAYAPSGGGKNGFGTLASPTRTLVASGSYTYSNVNYSESLLIAQMVIQPASIYFSGMGIEPKNLLPGINIELSVGNQINGASISFGELQMEPGHVISSWAGFEDVPHEEQVRNCAFYKQRLSGVDGITGAYAGRQTTTTATRIFSSFPEMRVKPTATAVGTYVDYSGGSTAATLTSQNTSKFGGILDFSHAAVGAAGNGVGLQIQAGAANYLDFDAELN